MKTATQKIVEEWENEKKKVRKISYYKRILSGQNQKRIEKIYKVLEIIKEEMAFSTDYGKYEPPFGAIIDKNKLLENKILVSDFKKITDLLSSSLYLAIPENKEWFSKEKMEEMEEKIFILFPMNDWDYDAREPCFKYPYEQNFENLDEAMEEIIRPKENLKTNNYNVVFDENTGILKINNKSVKFRKFTNQYYLLEIIFKDEESKNKDWQFSEIAELMDFAKNIQWKKLYNTVDAIKKKIAIETQIKDFFITTTQSIKINEKYLKKS